MNYKTNKNKKGFTMIEMLVSVAVFSIVVTMVMGTISTIVDASRKSRTITEVMNNLNFGFESMTRTLKTAKTINVSTSPGGSKIDTINATDYKNRTIIYRFYNWDDVNQRGITRQVDTGTPEPITSSNLKLSSWYIRKYTSSGTSGLGAQPRVFFSVKGRVETAKGISSEFTLQSSVSQRQLELGN